MEERPQRIWFDGELVPWEAATVHVLTHTLHYGFGAFEGIRSYALTDGGSAIFRLDDHLRRLYDSLRIIQITPGVTQDELKDAIHTVLVENALLEAYIRPIVFVGHGAMGLFAVGNPIHTAVAAFPWGAYLGEEGLRNGIRAKVSSFARSHVNTNMIKGKVCGHYVNNILAKREATDLGFEEAILLDTEGYVAEASGENIFVVRDGGIATPPITAVLGGITRASVIEIAKDLGRTVVERRISRDELYIADEIFITGTAAEVTPVREVDGRPVGAGRPGPITLEIQETFFAAARGERPAYRKWLDLLPRPVGRR